MEMRFGTWNIKTLNGKEVEMIQEMKRYKIKVLGLREGKKKGSGIKILEGNYVLRYSGIPIGNRAKEGVGIIVEEDMDSKVIDWKAINSRIMSMDIDVDEGGKLTFIQVYAPTEDSEVLEKEIFYTELQREVNRIEEKNRKPIIMGDLNGRVGQNTKIGHGALGRFGGEKFINGNGRRILEFCIENSLRIGNSYFKHKRIHQITYEGEGREAKSIIDYIIYPKEMSGTFKDVKVIRGAEASTDHRLLVADTRIRNNKKRGKNKEYERLKIEELREPNNRKKYEETIGERLRCMQEFQEEDNIDEMWRKIKETIMKAAEEICGKKRVNTGKKSTKWWNEELKQIVKEKKDSRKKFFKNRAYGRLYGIYT